MTASGSDKQTTETTSAETTGKPTHHWSRREGKGTHETAKSNPLAMGLKPSPHQARLDGHEHSRPGRAARHSTKALRPRALPKEHCQTVHEQPPAGMHKAHRANCKSIHSECMPKTTRSCPLRHSCFPASSHHSSSC